MREPGFLFNLVYLGVTGHPHPKRRFPGLEVLASHRSNYHGEGCQGMDMSCLKLRGLSSNLLLSALGRGLNFWRSQNLGIAKIVLADLT